VAAAERAQGGRVAESEVHIQEMEEATEERVAPAMDGVVAAVVLAVTLVMAAPAVQAQGMIMLEMPALAVAVAVAAGILVQIVVILFERAAAAEVLVLTEKDHPELEAYRMAKAGPPVAPDRMAIRRMQTMAVRAVSMVAAAADQTIQRVILVEVPVVELSVSSGDPAVPFLRLIREIWLMSLKTTQ